MDKVQKPSGSQYYVILFLTDTAYIFYSLTQLIFRIIKPVLEKLIYLY
jgi:hypothetical protein